MSEIRGGKYVNISASALLSSGSGKVFGAVINSSVTGTIQLLDSITSTGTLILNTYTLADGSQVLNFAEPIEYYTGLYCVITGTMDITWIIK